MESKLNVYKAIHACMAEIGYIKKDKTIGSGKSAYTVLSNMAAMNGIRDAMVKHNLISFAVGRKELPGTSANTFMSTDQYGNQVMKRDVFVDCEYTFHVVHTETGEYIETIGHAHGQDTNDKAAGKSATYAQKYMLIYLFKVSTGDAEKVEFADTDDAHVDSFETPPPPPPPAFEEDLVLFGNKPSKLAKWYCDKLNIEFVTPSTAEEAEATARELHKKYYGIS